MSSTTTNELHEELLVAYVLGALDPDEVQQVSTLLQTHPELRQQLAELRQVAALLPYGLPEATPSSDLRQRILDRANGKTPVTKASSATWRRRIVPWIAALSTALAVLFLALTISLQGRLNAQQNIVVQQERLVALLASPSVHLSVGQGDHGQATFVRSVDGNGVVAQLPQLERGRTYQLWLLKDKTSTPSSAGTFAVDQTGHGVLLLTDGQQASNNNGFFAITNEPTGGSPAPTTTILVLGQVATL